VRVMSNRRDSERPNSGGRGRVAGRVGTAIVLAGLAGAADAAGAGASPTPAQKEQARHDLLTLADMPAGWTSSPSTNSNSGSFTGAPQLASCIGVPTKYIATTPPEVDSPQFQNKGGTDMVQDSISFFPSVKFAQEEYVAITSKKTPGCLTTFLNSSLKSSLSGNTGASASALVISKARSPKGTTAFNVSTTVSGQGVSLPVKLLLVFFIHGQLGDAIQLSSYGRTALSPSFEQRLISVAQSRL
jgi:hypothetical protein